MQLNSIGMTNKVPILLNPVQVSLFNLWQKQNNERKVLLFIKTIIC